jgi:hypothetical protein
VEELAVTLVEMVEVTLAAAAVLAVEAVLAIPLLLMAAAPGQAVTPEMVVRQAVGLVDTITQTQRRVLAEAEAAVGGAAVAVLEFLDKAQTVRRVTPMWAAAAVQVGHKVQRVLAEQVQEVLMVAAQQQMAERAQLVLSGLFGEQVEHSHQRIQEMSNGIVH